MRQAGMINLPVFFMAASLKFIILRLCYLASDVISRRALNYQDDFL